MKLPGHLVGDQGAERVAGHEVRTRRVRLADRMHVPPRDLLNRFQDPPTGPDGLKAPDRAHTSEATGQFMKIEEASAGAGHAEERRALAARVNRHEQRRRALALLQPAGERSHGTVCEELRQRNLDAEFLLYTRRYAHGEQ